MTYGMYQLKFFVTYVDAVMFFDKCCKYQEQSGPIIFTLAATIMKKCWHTLSDLEEKVTPLPQCNVDPSHFVRLVLSDPPTLIDGGGEGLW